MSQSRLMRKADIDIRTIQRIYRDPYTNITLQTLDKLLDALECDICDLLEREKQPSRGLYPCVAAYIVFYLPVELNKNCP